MPIKDFELNWIERERERASLYSGLV